jgi:hypothetical protein
VQSGLLQHVLRALLAVQSKAVHLVVNWRSQEERSGSFLQAKALLTVELVLVVNLLQVLGLVMLAEVALMLLLIVLQGLLQVGLHIEIVKRLHLVYNQVLELLLASSLLRLRALACLIVSFHSKLADVVVSLTAIGCSSILLSGGVV